MAKKNDPLPRATVSVPRSRGALSGFLLLLLGAWGALLPFIGPVAHFGYGQDTTAFHWTAARFWLQFLPGIAAFVAGAIIITAKDRITGSIAAMVAIGAGAWFAIGFTLADLFRRGYVGTPIGAPGSRKAAFETIATFTGLGTLIAVLGALVLGRLSVVGVRDARKVAERKAEKQADRDESRGNADVRDTTRTETREVPATVTHVRVSDPTTSRVEDVREGSLAPDVSSDTADVRDEVGRGR